MSNPNEFINPFSSRPHRTLLDKFTTRDPQGNIRAKDIEAFAQDPKFSSFVDEYLANDR